MFVKKLFLLLLFLVSLQVNTSFAKDNTDSQPEIIFKYDKLKKNQENLSLQIDFNKAVLLLEKQEYEKAINIFKRTAQILQIPSFLNIGIAYYKQNSIYNAKLYLNKIFDYKEAMYSDTYSYMSASYYLYHITKELSYLQIIVDIGKRNKNVSEHAKRMLADTYILLGEERKAIKVLKSMQYPLNLKTAMLYIKIKDYSKAELFLTRAYEQTVNQDKLNKIIWVMIFRDLKSNEIDKLKDHLKLVEKRKSTFNTNFQLPLKIYFNESKYSSKEYFNFVRNFNEDRKIDFIFYFAPFIFSDNEEIIFDSSKGFIFKSSQNLQSLEKMIDYNIRFLKIIKDDPIRRVDKLKKIIQNDTKSYVYYNLALSYAQINDFHNAYKFFEKAYKLNPGNKLYAIMTLVSAKKINIKLRDRDYIITNIKSNKGLYKYFGHKIYQMLLDESYKSETKPGKYVKTIFYKGIKFLEEMKENKVSLKTQLIKEHYKDPLVYLIKMMIQKKNETKFNYRSRIQDNIPLIINNNFLKGPLIVTKYYVDVLKSLGLFSKAELKIDDEKSPSYLRTRALLDLHNNKATSTIDILDELQEIYELEDKYTMYLMVAALLEANRYNDASIQISLIKAILNDNEADFLTGVQLIQDLKVTSAIQYFKEPYMDSLIDFHLLNFDTLLNSL